MAINYHPKVGQILLCDFSQGFKVPEMIKSNRPVIVLTDSTKWRSNLVTVSPLSTKLPNRIQPCHYKIPREFLPMLNLFQSKDSWLKGDMLYTVGFHRLNLIRLGRQEKNGKRRYFLKRLDSEQMKKIYECIMHGLNLGDLAIHL